MKRKLWLGFGGLAAIVLPISAVVACNSDEKPTKTEIAIEKVKKLTGKKLVDAIPGSLYGAQDDNKNLFVSHIATKNSEWYLKSEISNDDFENAINDPKIELDSSTKEMLKNILKSTNNNAKLASAIILFTFKTADEKIKPIVKFGLLDPSDEENNKKVWEQIVNSSLYYKKIAKAMMIKFSGESSLGWNLEIIQKGLKYEKNTKTFSEGISSYIINALGGTETVKTILEASGYKYISK